MTTPLNVLGICGSLRQASYNAAALRVAQALAPDAGMSSLYRRVCLRLRSIGPGRRDEHHDGRYLRPALVQ